MELSLRIMVGATSYGAFMKAHRKQRCRFETGSLCIVSAGGMSNSQRRSTKKYALGCVTSYMTTRPNSDCDYDHLDTFLGAFAKLRNATISFAMSVRVSVRIEPLGSHWTDIHEI